MSAPPKKTAAELLAAAKAKLAAAKTRKNNNGASRAASPARSVSVRSSSAARSRSLAAQIAHSEALAKKLREQENSKGLSSMSNLETLAAKPAKRAVSNEVASLERKVESLERSHAAKLKAAENYKERRADSRGRYAEQSLSVPQWARPGVRTSEKKAANNKVEAINKDYKRMLREASVVETALRKAQETLEKKRGKMSVMASAASSRAASPTGSVRSTSSASSRRLTANQHNARLANLRKRHTAKLARNEAAAAKKTETATKRLADAYKKLKDFDEDILEAFCEDLKSGKRNPSSSIAVSRAASPAARAASPRHNNLNLR